ncbi:hypothetical protein G7046_g1357 [Stylonectria norvegica]|nr:hypothetical protein G7046_g1357 [Stylonectria norvegica]
MDPLQCSLRSFPQPEATLRKVAPGRALDLFKVWSFQAPGLGLRRASGMTKLSTSSAFTATPIKHAFNRRVEDVKSPKSEINTLILDYLTMEGYPNAAAKFSKEANLQPQQDIGSIHARQQIQSCIHAGNIETAIDALNELDPEILDGSEGLHFALLRLQLIELIRVCNATPGGDIEPALTFARDRLGPRAPSNPQFLDDLESTMALLLFPLDALDPQLAVLLKPELRREVADDVNRAILEKQSQRREAAIRQLVRMRAWAENTARDRGKALPDRIDIGLHNDDSGRSRNRLNAENGHEAMITT